MHPAESLTKMQPNMRPSPVLSSPGTRPPMSGVQPRSRARPYPIAAAFVSLAVLCVTWNGIRLTGGVSPADLLFALALFIVAFHVIAGDEQLPIPAWLLAAALGLLAASLLAALFYHGPQPVVLSQSPFGGASQLASTYSDSNLAGVAKFELALFFVPLLIAVVATSVERVRSIAELWVASAVICCLVAIADQLTGAGIGRSVTGELFIGREAGFSVHPNHLGLIGAMTLPVAFALAEAASGARRATFSAAAIVLIGGVLVCGSRLGLAAVVFALLLSFPLLVRGREKLAVALIAVVVAGGLFAWFAPGGSPLVAAIDRVANGGTATQLADAQRLSQFHQSLDVATQHALTGVGFATVADAHSLPIQLVEAGGVVALAAFLVFAWGAIALGIRLVRDSSLSAEARLLAGGMTASLGVWLLSGLLQNPVTDRYLYVPVGLLLGLALLLDAGAPRGIDGAEIDANAGAGEVLVHSLARPLP